MTKNAYFELYTMKSFFKIRNLFNKNFKFFGVFIKYKFVLKKNELGCKNCVEDYSTCSFFEFFYKMYNRFFFKKDFFKMPVFFLRNILKILETFIKILFRSFGFEDFNNFIRHLSRILVVDSWTEKIKYRLRFFLFSYKESKSHEIAFLKFQEIERQENDEVFLFEIHLEQLRINLDKEGLSFAGTCINRFWSARKMKNFSFVHSKCFWIQLVRFLFFYKDFIFLGKLYYLLANLEKKAISPKILSILIPTILFWFNSKHYEIPGDLEKLTIYIIFQNLDLKFFYLNLINFSNKSVKKKRILLVSYLNCMSSFSLKAIKRISTSVRASIICKKIFFFSKEKTSFCFFQLEKLLELDHRDLENWVFEVNNNNPIKIKIDKLSSLLFII
jgi:hypothetical protein